MKKLSLIALVLSFVMGQAAFAVTGTQSSSSANQSSTGSSKTTACGCGDRMREMMSSLNLNSAQQAKIKAIKDDLRKSQHANREQLRTISGQIRDLVTSDSMDDSKLTDLVNQKKELLAQMLKAKIVAKQQIYSVLTTEQKSQFKQSFKQWAEKRKHC